MLTGAGLAFIVIMIFGAAPRFAHATVEHQLIMKELLPPGAGPTSLAFESILTMEVFRVDPSFILLDFSGDNLGVSRLDEGTVVDSSMINSLMKPGLSASWAGESGYLGLSLRIDESTHYGFLQISAGPPGGDQRYPMLVEALAWETVPDLAITTFPIPVPEPGTFLMVAMGSALMTRVRRIPVRPDAALL